MEARRIYYSIKIAIAECAAMPYVESEHKRWLNVVSWVGSVEDDERAKRNGEIMHK